MLVCGASHWIKILSFLPFFFNNVRNFRSFCSKIVLVKILKNSFIVQTGLIVKIIIIIVKKLLTKI